MSGETSLEFIIPYGEQITLHFLGNTPNEAQGITVNSQELKKKHLHNIYTAILT